MTRWTFYCLHCIHKCVIGTHFTQSLSGVFPRRRISSKFPPVVRNSVLLIASALLGLLTPCCHFSPKYPNRKWSLNSVLSAGASLVFVHAHTYAHTHGLTVSRHSLYTSCALYQTTYTCVRTHMLFELACIHVCEREKAAGFKCP